MCAATVHGSKALTAVFLLAALGADVAIADMNGGRSSAAAQYEVERAMCLRGMTNQDLDTCMREAQAAYAQAKRGGLQDEAPALYEANRIRRCDPLPIEQRLDCIARMQGQGTISGSVVGGGINRELVTTMDKDAPAAGTVAPNR